MEAHTFAQDIAFTIMAVTWMGGMLLAAYLSPLLISGGQKIMSEHDPYAEVQSLRTALADARGVIASRNLTIARLSEQLTDLELENNDLRAGVDANGVSNA